MDQYTIQITESAEQDLHNVSDENNTVTVVRILYGRRNGISLL